MDWQELLCGPRLLRCGVSGPPLPTAQALRPATLIGLYFPWAGGQQFTEHLRALHAALPGGLEIVQVAWASLNASVHGEVEDPEAFLSDIQALPWCAVPLEDVGTRVSTPQFLQPHNKLFSTSMQHKIWRRMIPHELSKTLIDP